MRTLLLIVVMLLVALAAGLSFVRPAGAQSPATGTERADTAVARGLVRAPGSSGRPHLPVALVGAVGTLSLAMAATTAGHRSLHDQPVVTPTDH